MMSLQSTLCGLTSTCAFLSEFIVLSHPPKNAPIQHMLLSLTQTVFNLSPKEKIQTLLALGSGQDLCLFPF